MKKPTYQDLVLMVDILTACIETRVLPAIGSPMHRQAREFVEASGCAPARERLSLPAEAFRKVPHAVKAQPAEVLPKRKPARIRGIDRA